MLIAARAWSLRSAAGQAVPALGDPVALLAGVGVGLCSSVIPYVPTSSRWPGWPRATYALMVALLPATAAVIGVVVLAPAADAAEAAGVALVIAGVALHRDAGPRSGRLRGRGSDSAGTRRESTTASAGASGAGAASAMMCGADRAERPRASASGVPTRHRATRPRSPRRSTASPGRSPRARSPRR